MHEMINDLFLCIHYVVLYMHVGECLLPLNTKFVFAIAAIPCRASNVCNPAHENSKNSGTFVNTGC